MTRAPLSTLRELRLPPPAPQPECCEFCDATLAGSHDHVVDLERRTLVCACRACYLLFTQPGAARGRYRAASDRVVALPDRPELPGLWLALQIPVGVAFVFFHSGLERVVACYPSPAGVTESELPLDTWSALTRELPVLNDLAPDVEAVLVRARAGPPEALIVPIDACYELAGRIRQRWTGMDGGDAVWHEVDECLHRLRSRAITAESAMEIR